MVEALEVLEGIEGVAKIRFSSEDVVRHKLVAAIVEAYDRAPKPERPEYRRRGSPQ